MERNAVTSRSIMFSILAMSATTLASGFARAAEPAAATTQQPTTTLILVVGVRRNDEAAEPLKPMTPRRQG